VVDGDRTNFLPDVDGAPKKKLAMLVRFALVEEVGERCDGIGESPTPPAASKLMYEDIGPLRLECVIRRGGDRMLLLLGSIVTDEVVKREVVECALPRL
jgi:hypothetical protein